MAKQETLEKIPDCDKKVYHKGEHIATIIDLEPEKIEEIVKSTAKKTGQKIDWHYFGGSAVVKALGDIGKARSYLKSELEKHNCQSYRFTTDNNSGMPWPIK